MKYWLIFLLGSAGACAADFVSVGEAPAVLYDAPSPMSKKLFVLSPHYPLEIVVALDKWTKVRDNGGQISWVEKSMLSPKRYVMISSRVADVRQSPDDKSALVFQAEGAVLLELIEISGGWIKVRHQGGQTGFVKASQVWGG